jgi:RNA polymerase sigma factor (TIGR02999 family)
LLVAWRRREIGLQDRLRYFCSCAGLCDYSRRFPQKNIAGGDLEHLTDLLQLAHGGDRSARERLFAVAYEELRQQARSQLRGGGRNTFLDTTVLVHESYLRFLQAGQLNAGDRGHFFAYAGRVMRSVIVDFARKRQAERRGGAAEHVELDTQLAEDIRASDDGLIRVNEALEALQEVDCRLVQVVEMRFFVGMTESEIAEALGVADRTVRRDWEKAKLLLTAALR